MRTSEAGLIVLTLLSRILLLSQPYYVDGPNHVKAVQDGSLFIQPPGYFLFAFSARMLTLVSSLSAAAAISGLNVAFSVAGVWVFRRVTAELFPGTMGLLLACCYAVSNVVWFAAEIHSTYASMTFFGPLLFFILIVRERIAWGWVIWAVLTGFRPSDGIFLLPVMIFASARRPWRESFRGVLLAAPVCALWYVPTMLHFGGSMFAPLAAANRQLGQLPSGIVVHGFTAKGLNNIVHFLFGTVNAWNLLLPFVIAGLWATDRVKWYCVAWIAPACLFLALYFVSDSMYLAVLVAPGVVLAGLGLRQFVHGRATPAVALASVVLAVIHMVALRPVPARNVATAVIDSYSLEYTGWALKHRYARRLASVVGELQKR